MVRKLDIWGELAKQIVKEMLNPNKVFPEHRHDLEQDIRKVILEFVDERIVTCYFRVNKHEVLDPIHKNGGEKV